MSENKPKPTSKAKKATKAIVITRISEIKDLLLKGKSRGVIQQFAATSYNLTERVIDEYIARATQEIKEMSNTDRSTDLGILLERLYKMANDAEDKGDQKTASSILMNIAKLKSLDNHSIHHIIEKRDLAQLSDSDLEVILEDSNEKL